MDQASASNHDHYHASSNSSDDEIILFQGRNQHAQATNQLGTVFSKKKAVEYASNVEARNRGGIGLTVQLAQSRRNTCHPGRGRGYRETSDNDSVLDDYIANIRDNDPLIQRTRNADVSVSPYPAAQQYSEQHYFAVEPKRYGHMSRNDVPISHSTTDGDTDSVSEDSEPSAIDGDEDDDMERKLHMAWNKDRLRKKKRKQHREELRSIGVLGQNKVAQDMRAKYPLGMSVEHIAYEMKCFLINKVQTLPLPPMDPQARRTVHELAGRFRIKSKSKGHADQRQPTLYRTRKTLSYVESTFNQAIARIEQRNVQRRPTVKGRKPDNRQLCQNRNNDTTSYKEGDIVGARAPELGAHNRGRAILEKMGWSSGTALGAMHNKGILQPVTQAVKRSKAGLG
ncbi:hypothetical protein CDD82_1949 [Ophiocordyceps australis]|uniref:Protein SQS1 n=1 Tax=Ophiocordyceps australis TaxID=1399860 RepID=A0A2C5Y7V3_9HYPO|nr:hypothetical protein CDD82_1949 [Ophiocordyceps australis]